MQHRYQQHHRQILPPVLLVLLIPVAFATGVNDTGGKFDTGFKEAGGKFPPISTTPAANLPPGVNDTGGKQWEQYQTVGNLK